MLYFLVNLFLIQECVKLTEANNCGSPPSLSGGSRYVSGDYAYYSCNTGYSASGTNYIQCVGSLTGWLMSYSWSSLSYSCTIRNCGNPGGITNGQVSYRSTVYQSSASYSCDTGYNVIGSPTSISCLDTGVWQTTTAACQIVDCGAPETIADCDISAPDTTLNNTAVYTCHNGHNPSQNDTTIVCTLTGWENITFWCIPEDCGIPLNITNGGRSYLETTYGNTATYYCDTGYYGSGDDTINCNSDGTWDILSFNCYLNVPDESSLLVPLVIGLVATAVLVVAAVGIVLKCKAKKINTTPSNSQQAKIAWSANPSKEK